MPRCISYLSLDGSSLGKAVVSRTEQGGTDLRPDSMSTSDVIKMIKLFTMAFTYKPNYG